MGIALVLCWRVWRSDVLSFPQLSRAQRSGETFERLACVAWDLSFRFSWCINDESGISSKLSVAIRE